MTNLEQLLTNEKLPHYLHGFMTMCIHDSKEEIERKILWHKNSGVNSILLIWADTHKGGRCDFDQPKYWESLGWFNEVCKREGMTYIIQDAAGAPTGEADGWFEKPEFEHLKKLYLAERHFDAYGPDDNGMFLIDEVVHPLRRMQKITKPKNEKLIAVIASKITENGEFLGENIDITDKVCDGVLYWEIPDGIWRIFVISQTYRGQGLKTYMNLLDKDSVGLMIKSLYEPHIEHLGDDLGKTWLGFFYDETEVGNCPSYDFLAKIGQKPSGNNTVTLPWSLDMEKLCQTSMGKDYRLMLPMLWFETGKEFAVARYNYMTCVSKLIRDNYNGQMHKWCQEHKVLYIGHNLEDERSHNMLSSGPVNIFRMQEHQDWTGVDLIGGQIMPYKDGPNAWYGNHYGDGTFYHYGLAKLGSSIAHISPISRGRCVCEYLNVYEGIDTARLNKFLIDHLLVNGVNYLIPAEDYGMCVRENYKFLKPLYTYAARMCHFLNNTKQLIKTAILYEGDLAWFDDTAQGFHLIGKEFARNQISYDCVPSDVFEYPEKFLTETDNGLTINGNKYEASIVPSTTVLPKSVIEFIEKAKKSGFPVFFVDKLPHLVAENGQQIAIDYGKVVELEKIANEVKNAISPDLTIADYQKWLRYLHTSDNTGDYYYLHNEGKDINTTCKIKGCGPLIKIDALNQKAYKIPYTVVGDYCEFNLSLAEFEAVIVFSGDTALEIENQPIIEKEADISGEWTITLNGNVSKTFTSNKLTNLNGRDMFPRYSGETIYNIKTTFDKLPDSIDFGKVYESCELFINGQNAGIRFTEPYRFDNIKQFAKIGENTITLHVTNALGYAPLKENGHYWGSLSATYYSSLNPGGLLGPVKALYNK